MDKIDYSKYQKKTINGQLFHRPNDESAWVGLSYTQLNERIVQLNKRNNEAVIKYIRTQRQTYKTARQSAHNDGRTNDFTYYDGKTIALSEILGHFCELDPKK